MSNSSSVNSVTKALGDLRLKKNDLQDVLDKTGFSIFNVISDLGYYRWNPNPKNSAEDVSEVTGEEVRRNVEPDTTPNEIISPSKVQLPMPFQNLSPQKVDNKYPNGQNYIVELYVALKHRKVQEKIDFVFGGSTLHMLTTRNIDPDTQYVTTYIPETDTVIVAKHKPYIQNYSDPGFQFERLATGGTFSDRHVVEFTNHLQLIRVGNHNVLFTAEADACHADGGPVEIKCSNPRYWGTKTMFQMISSGSLHLFQGRKSRSHLTDVNLRSLSDVARTSLYGKSVQSLEANIEDGMEALRDAVERGEFEGRRVNSISFSGSSMKLRPFSGKAFFDSRTIKELLE